MVLIDALTVGAGASRVSQESNKDFARLIASFIEMLYPTLAKDTGINPVLIAQRAGGLQRAHRHRVGRRKVRHPT